MEETTEDPIAILEAACSVCSLKDCITQVSLDYYMGDKSTNIHFLIHVDSVVPYRESSVKYATDAALTIIARHKMGEARSRMNWLLEAFERNPLVTSLSRYVFEEYAIEMLEKGGKFTCRRLVGDTGKRLKPTETQLVIPPSLKTVGKVSEKNTLNKLYVPTARIHATIDAWIPGIGGFQMTVGKSRDIVASFHDDVAKLGTNKLYWLLPPPYYGPFTKEILQSIDQYALLIPYPSIE
jgi:hypothetical protein